MAITLEALKQIQQDTGITTFVETGTALGQGVNRAIEAGFSRIFTIERFGDAYRDADRSFAVKTCPHGALIGMFFGDSAYELMNVLLATSGPVVIYLDAHATPGTPKFDDHPSPILKEIGQIGRWCHGQPDDCIVLIDDVRIYDHPNKWGVRLEMIYAALEIVGFSHFRNVDGEVPGDVLVAERR